MLSWYADQARDLPWRQSSDPYVVLVSEVMLQQTQVARVIPYFERFVSRFPTVEDLAQAPLAEVLTVWSGLGYNARARRLRSAASQISADGWPTTVEGLEALPGVGPYTARAVGALAFGLDVVPVDTNMRRVLSRWHGTPLQGEALQSSAETEARGVSAAAWSQAVMDLGATLCAPRAPQCEVCPVERWCSGPDTYVPPRSQPRFKGSQRQLRGAIMRKLIDGPATVEHLTPITGFDSAATREALRSLESDGLVEQAGENYRLPA